MGYTHVEEEPLCYASHITVEEYDLNITAMAACEAHQYRQVLGRHRGRHVAMASSAVGCTFHCDPQNCIFPSPLPHTPPQTTSITEVSAHKQGITNQSQWIPAPNFIIL